MKRFLPFLLTACFAVSAKADGPKRWFDNAVIYEIYPRSFQDTNGDGVGDLKGITQHLDYLKSLGIDAIWIAPCYPSPQVDFGYDIADYTSIDPQYGTMADFDELMAKAKERNIRIVMDLVLNHTSSKHQWFVESSASKDNPKRNWYVWNSGKKGKDGKPVPPNNWQSLFGHSAWQWDEKTQQFYYHMFYAEQPDLNWSNPEVRKAMYDVAKFWLDKGVAGFRLDAVDTLFEVKDLRNAKEGPGKNAYGDPVADFTLQAKQPGVHDVLRELRALVDTYKDDRLLIGEIYTKDVAELQPWYGKKNDELQLPMDTHLIGITKFTVPQFRKRLVDAQTKLGGRMPLLVTDNHDQKRSWDRFGNGKNDEAIAKITAMALLGTRSTALVYYGQEIGMVTSTPTKKEDVKDPIGIVGWPGEKGRDGERTPMQWNMSKNGGFTSGTPWLPVPATVKTVNVTDETSRPDSVLSWYRGLLGLRKTHPSFQGSTKFIDLDYDGVLCFVRNSESADGGAPVILAANFGATPVIVSVEADLKAMKVSGKGLKSLLVTDAASAAKATLQGIELPAFGIYIGEVQK